MKSWRMIVIFDELELERKFIDTNSIDRVGRLTLHLQGNQLSQHLNLLFQRSQAAVLNLRLNRFGLGLGFLGSFSCCPCVL